MIKLPEVKRHSVEGYGRQDICYNDPYGEFVYYEDYANLRQDLDRLQAEVQRLNATAQPVSDGWVSLLTDRQRSVINFALHRFMSDAYGNASIVAQDKRLDSSMADTFIADAKDAEALMGDISRHRDKLAAAPGGQDD